VLLPAVAGERRRRVWPWLLAVVVVAATAVGAWLFWPTQTGQDQQVAGTVPIGASFTYPSGLVVTVSDVSPYTSTNPSIVSSGDTAYRGTVTLVNGSSTAVNSAVMTIDVATGAHSDDRIFENALPPTRDIAPGQRLAVPFAYTVVKQATGPLRVTVTAVPDHPAVFVGATS
jgi:hypothetical protein